MTELELHDLQTPFVDQRRVRNEFYTDTERTSVRSRALLASKVVGNHVPDVVVKAIRDALELTPEQRLSWSGNIADLGCGRGASSLALIEQFPSAQVLMVDLSEAVLSSAVHRLSCAGYQASAVRGDFHQLPLADQSCGIIVAAFCLYHSAAPVNVLSEIARTLTDDGIAVLVTKSGDSYQELDALVASSGLDPNAAMHPSLYATFNSENCLALTEVHLNVLSVVSEQHVFRFPDLAGVAVYLATSPKYSPDASMFGNADAIEARLRASCPEQSTQTTSTVTYLVAARSRLDQL